MTGTGTNPEPVPGSRPLRGNRYGNRYQIGCGTGRELCDER